MPQVLLKVLGAQSGHVRARRDVRALRRSCLESLQKLCVCSMSATVPPSQLLAGRVMLSVATALLLSAAASVMGAAPPPPPNCASPCSLSHAPPVPDKPVGLAAGEVAPMPPAVSCTALAVLRRPHWLTRLRAGAAAVRAGARAGGVRGGGRGGQAAGERSVPPELRAVLRSRARACRSQPISLSAMMDGASASFEDFNPDFMVRCLFTGPVHHRWQMHGQRCLFTGRLCRHAAPAACAVLSLSLTGGGRALVRQVFHGRRASQAK